EVSGGRALLASLECAFDGDDFLEPHRGKHLLAAASANSIRTRESFHYIRQADKIQANTFKRPIGCETAGLALSPTRPAAVRPGDGCYLGLCRGLTGGRLFPRVRRISIGIAGFEENKMSAHRSPEQVHAKLDHPVIDGDGHWLEYTPVFAEK